MGTRKSEWLAAIKPILDREEARRDAKELAKELGDILEINIDANPENLKQLTDEFNSQLSKMGKQPIVFSEKTLKGIVNQFADAIASGFAKGADVGVAEALKRQLDGLKKQRQEIIKEQNKIKQNVQARSRIEKLETFEIGTAKPLKVEGDIGQEAQKLVDVLYKSADQIEQAEKKYGKASVEYVNTVLDAQEAYNKYLRMQKTIKLMPSAERSSISKDVRASYDVLGKDRDSYEVAGGINIPFEEDFAAEKILDAFEELSDVFEGISDNVTSLQKQLQQVGAEIDSIAKKIREIGTSDGTAFADAKDGLKTLQEVEAAYGRISKKKATKGGHKPIDKVADALEYTPGSASLTTLRNRYSTSLSSGADWEEQYQWLIKFVKEYEAQLERINAEEDKTKKKNDLATLKKYTELYKELKPLASEAEVSLLEVAKKAGYQPEKVVGDMDSVVALDTQMAQKAREEAAKRAEAEKRAEESLRQQRIEEEKIAKAKAKQRLEDEKIAEAKRRAAEEAEKEARARSFATNGTGGDSTSHKQTTLYDMAQDVNGKEKFAYLNTDTGKISEYIEGGYEGVTKTAIKELLNSIGETMNATIHSHPESIAAPSDDDIQSFVNDIGEFKRNFILAGKQLAEIDFSELTREQAQMIADVYKVNVSNTEDERYGRLMTSLMKGLGIPLVDSDRVFAAVSEQLKARFPALLSDIDTYIEKLRAIFTATPIIDLSQGELEDVISDEVESDFKNQDRSQQSEIYEITKELIDNITGIPAMYQQELQNIFKQTIEYLDFDASKIFKLYDVDDFQANLDTAYGRTIEDVTTARDEADAHRRNADAINAEAEAQEELNKVTAAAPDAKQSEASSSSGDTSSAELEAMQKQIAELQEQKNQEMEAKDAEITQIRETSAAQLEAANNEKVSLQNDLDLARQQAQSAQDELAVSQARESEVTQKLAKQEVLNRQLREQLANVKTGVNEEPGASVGADDLKRILGEVIYKVKITHDDNDKQANKIALDETALEGTLKRVFSKFIDPVAEASESRQEVEPWALEKTLLSVKEVLGQIQTNTAQKQSLEIAPAKTEVGPVLATEGTLAAIKTAVEAINKKVVKGTKADTSDSHRVGGTTSGADGKNAESYAGSQYFPEKLKTQTVQLAKFRAQLLTTGKLTDDVDTQIYELLDSLKKIRNGPDFSVWGQKFQQLKASVGITDIFGKVESKEETASYKQLIEYQKTRNKLELEYTKAQDGSALKQFYAEQLTQMDSGIAHQQEMIDNEEYKAKLAKLREEQERKLGAIEAKATDKDAKKKAESAKKEAQVESKEETASYKQLIEYQKTRNKLELEYTKAQDGSALKQFYAEQLTQMDSGIAHQQEMIDNEEYKAKLAKLREEQERKLGAIEAKATGKDAKKKAESAKKEAQKDAMLGRAGNAVGRAETAWMNTGDIIPEASPEVNALIDEYYQKIIVLRQEKEKLRQSESITQAEKDAVIQHTQNLNRMTAEVQELVSEYQKLSGANVNEANTRTTSLTGESSIQQYQQQMKAYVSEITHGQGQIKSFDAATKTLTYTVKTGSHEFTEYTVALRRVDDSLVSVQGATKKTETFFESTKRKIGEISSYITGMGVINLAKNQLKQGIQYIKEIDDALTELKKVTNATTETYDKFLKTAAKTADKTGSTMTNIIQSTADWVKLGNTLADATKLAETTSVLLNVSEFESIDSATSALVSTIQAFGYAVKDSMSIVDVMNEIGNTYAVSSDGIATALQDSASSLVAANNSYEEAVAMIAAGNRVIQDPSSLGSGLRTIALRLRGTSVEGEDDDGLITSTSKLQSKIKALSGVDILTDTGAYKSTYQILLEISDVWEQMSDIDQAALLEIIAGKNRSNIASALLSNPTDLRAALESAQNAEGSALKENEKYLDSIQGKLDQFNNAVQSMWSNTLDSDWVKDIVDFGTEIIKLIDNIGVLRIAVAAFITYVAKKWGGLDFSAMFSGLTEKGINKIFGKSVNQNIDATTSKLEELEQAVKRAKQAYVDDGGSKASQKALKNAEEQLETYKKLQKEGFNPADKSKGYFGTEIQKIKDYKQELAGLETAIPEAEQALRDAENELNHIWSQGEFGDVDIDEYIDKVDKAKLHVDDLKKKHADLKKSGSGAFQSLADGANALTKQIQSAVTSMLVMYTISKAMQIISDLWDAAFETADEAKETFEDLGSELETTKSELNTLESQLQDVKSQIEDINANTPLTFTDEEELSRLEAQSAELQRQIDLLETIKREQSKGVNDSAINAAQKYAQTGVSTGKTTGENVGEKAGTGAAVGAGVGVATGVGGAILTAAGAGTALGAWAGPVGMLIGAAIGAIAGATIGAVVGGIESASEETVGESLNNMKDQYAKLQSEFETARKNYTNDASSSNKKKFEEAQEALNNYQSNMANYISEMDTYYSQIKQNWDTATTEQKEEYAEWADTMDAWAIQSNGVNAKANAIERIFGEDADGGFATAKAQIEAINAEIKKAQESGDEVAIASAFEKLDGFTLDVLSDEEVDRLYNMGIYLHEAEDYFKKVVKSESEFVDVGLYDVVTDINKITDGLESMKTAFDEIIERGSVTAKTMVSLNETFSEFNKTTDGAKAWLSYSNTVFSGAASIEQMTKATEEYVKAYLDYELAQNNLTPENKWTYVIQLQSLGVENAQEYVNELLQKNLVDELSHEYSLEIDTDSLREAYDIANMDIGGPVQPFEDLDDTQLTKLAEEYGLINDLSDEAKTEIAERYGVEEDAIDDIIGKLKLKQKAESTLSQAEQKQTDYDTFLDKYEKAKQDLEQAQKGVGEYTIAEVGVYTVDGWYYNGEYYNDPKTIVTAIDQEALYIAQEAYDKIKTQYSQYFDEQGNLKTTVPTEIAIEIKNAQSALDKAVEDLESLSPEMQLKLDLQDFDDGVDTIQSAYSMLKDTVAEYNSQGFLSLDNLQAILNLQPEYLSCLQMENGQLTINQSAMEAMLKTKLADAKATAIQSAITQLNTLAEKKEALATNDTALAASNASLAMGSYTGTLSTFTSQAIVAAGAAETLRAALEGAEGNQYVNKEEIAQVWTNLENSLSLIQSLEDALPNSFNQILDPGSNTAEEETAEAIEDKIQEGWEALLSKYENELALITNERDLIQAEIDNMEAQGGKASAKYYDDLIRNSNEEQELLKQKLVALQEYLNANKDAIDQDTWTEYNNEINETAVAIKECTKNTLEWKEALRDIDQHYFDQATDGISRLKEELEFVDGLFEDEDVADENGNWSSAALTRLGMYTNQLELAAAEAARYKEEITKLDEQYKKGELSEEQYQEALSEAISGQQSAIQSYEDAKDSIVELNEARIDAIKNGIEKEIEAFKDLTDAKKKELDAERD